MSETHPKVGSGSGANMYEVALKSEPQTTTESGSPVSDRVATPAAAFKLYYDLCEQTRIMAESDARVIAMYNGNPPYSTAELVALGQGWRANINSRELKAAVNAKTESAYELHMEASTRIEVRVNPTFSKQADVVPEQDWGAVIAEEYTQLLLNWREGYFSVDLATRESVKLGLGLMVFGNEWDWRPKAFKKSCLRINPNAKALPDCIEVFALDDEMTAGELYEIISDPKAAKDEGWNVGAVKDLLVRVFRQGETTDQFANGVGTPNVWEWIEQRIKNRDPDLQMKAFSKVPIAHIAVKEVTKDGGVTHIIIPRREGTDQKFLRKVKNRFKKMEHLLWLLPYGYEDGFIGSLRGLGHELFTYSEVSNRTLCSALDGGMIAGGLLLEAQTGFDAEQLQIMRNGPVTVVPPGLKAVQSTFSPPIVGLIQLRSMLRDITSNNVGLFPARQENSPGERDINKTAREIVSQDNKEARYEKNRANFEYLMWESWHQEIMRRLLNPEYIFSTRDLPGAKEARGFVRACLMRGVPLDLLVTPGAFQIRVTRVIGLGSPGARMDITSQMMAVRGGMDETGRRNAEREYAAARVGYFNVDKYYPLRNRDKIPSNEVSIATLENNDLRAGQMVVAGSDQVHALHLDQAHFPLFQQMVEVVKSNPEQADLLAIYKTLRVGLPHAYEHVQYLTMDPTRQQYVEKAVAVLQFLADFYKNIERKIVKDEEMQQQLAADQAAQQMMQFQQQLSQENQLKLKEIELKSTLEQMKQASLNQMRADKTADQMAIKRWQAEQDANLNRWKAEQDAMVKRFMAEQKAVMDQIKASLSTLTGAGTSE